MSLIANAAASAASTTAGLFTHGHKKGAHVSGKDGTAAGGTPGPATTQSLLSSLFESIEQVIGISLTAPPRAASAAIPSAGAVSGVGASAAATANTATGAAAGVATASNTGAAAVSGSPATPGSVQDAQGFLHSLLQALKADGPGGAGTGNVAGSALPGNAAAGPGAGGGGGARYEGSLVSSLQSLMHQVGTGSPATADLNASFSRLVRGSNVGAAADGPGTAPQASLQSFLGSLLRNMQSNGVHSVSAAGASVNAKV